MHLTSTNGNSISVRVDAYQFPAKTGSGEWDHDANWLMVAGVVVAAGRTWSFRDPCLLTWEAQELATWLRSVIDGTRQPAPVGINGDGGDLLVFTEPNLAFNLHDRTADDAVLRVFLSLEAAPPNEETEIFEYFVELTTTAPELSRALAEWEDELRLFPARP